MKNLVIVCDSAFGLDVKKIALLSSKFWKEHYDCDIYTIKGFIGADTVGKPLQDLLIPYMGPIDEYSPVQNDYFVMAIVDPVKKKETVKRLKAKGAIFETLWAPWVMAHLDSTFPEGCIIAAQSVMDSARIGKFVTLFHSMVGFDADVGDYSSVMAYANITSAHIGECVYIKDNSVILCHEVCDEAVIEPNSVVVKTVKKKSTVSGNPARKIKK